MYAARKFIFQLLFWFGTAVFAFAMLVVSPFGVAPLRVLKRLWLKTSMALARVLIGIDYRITGLQNLPDGPCLVVMKHQSAWDTLIPGLILPRPGYVMKRELLDIPLFGWLLQRWPVIALNRGRASAALRQLIVDGKSIVAEHQPQIVIFPEGTRRAPGEATKYQIGTAVLAEQLAIPVVPVALNSGLYWGKGWLNYQPGTIQLDIMQPLPDGLGKRELMAELERKIETRSKELADL